MVYNLWESNVLEDNSSDRRNAEFKADVAILAGGFGSRLKAVIGNNIPKPMALFNGIPLLRYQIELCRKYGFTNILILVHHLGSVITEYFDDGSDSGVNIKYMFEPVPRGTAGALADCSHLLADEFIVIYGDTFLDVDLRDFFNYKLAKSKLLTFVHPNSHPYDSDLLVLDSDGYVVHVFRPKNSGDTVYNNVVNAGLYVCNIDIFNNYVPPVGQMDISSELFPKMIRNGDSIQSYRSVEYIKDMGTPERYKRVQLDLLNGIPEVLSSRNLRRCVFLDRDGVINKEIGYLSDVSDFVLLDGVGESIKLLNQAGFLVICITNQPVIARGELTIPDLEKIHMKMESDLGLEGAFLDGIYFCPHHPDSGFEGEVKELKKICACRKPEPGMIFNAQREFNIDLKQSWFVGDHNRDIQAGINAGTKTILLSDEIQAGVRSDESFSTLFQAVEHILNTAGVDSDR